MGAIGWLAQAACREASPRVFFTVRLEDEAKEICAGCPVRAECLEHALENQEDDGVWGGLTAAERLVLLQAATPTNNIPVKYITYTTRARSTGTVCSAGRTALGGWGVMCQDHGSTASTRSRSDAGRAVSRPEEWCPACGRTSVLREDGVR